MFPALALLPSVLSISIGGGLLLAAPVVLSSHPETWPGLWLPLWLIACGVLQFRFGSQKMYSCPAGEPCHLARVGAFLLTLSIYAAVWPQVFFGASFDVVISKLVAGDIFSAKGLWGALLVLGVGTLAAGLRAMLSHDDPIDWQSLCWSGGVIALALWAISHEWYLTDSAVAWHASRALWLAWMASNGVNLWLQLRGVFGWRGNHVVPVQPYYPAVPGPPSPEYFSWRRWFRRTEWSDGTQHYAETEGFEETEWQTDAVRHNNNPLPQGDGGFMARVQEFYNDLPAALPDESPGPWSQIPHTPENNKVVPLLPRQRRRLLGR
jgi:hypothetical protein